MPSRIPLSFTPSSSNSSSASSSFVPHSAFNTLNREPPHGTSNAAAPTTTTTTASTSTTTTTTATTGILTDLGGLAELRDNRSQSLESSLSSSRDEYEPISYTPIYPSYSSSFSNSSLEFHESLLLAIRERQQQQMMLQQMMLNRMRTDTTSSTHNAMVAAAGTTIAGDFYTNANATILQRPSTVSETSEQAPPLLGLYRTLLLPPQQDQPLQQDTSRMAAAASERVANVYPDNTPTITLDSDAVVGQSQHHQTLSNADPLLRATPPNLRPDLNLDAARGLDQTQEREQDGEEASDSVQVTTSSWDQRHNSPLLLARSLAMDQDQNAALPLNPGDVLSSPMSPRAASTMERQVSRTLGQEIHTPPTINLNPQITYSSEEDTDTSGGGMNAEGTSLSPRSYSASIFGATNQRGSHTTDTRQALSQVMMSFQGVALDRPFDDASFAPRVDNLLSATGPGTSNYTTVDGHTDGMVRPRALSDLGPHPDAPSRPLVSHEGPLIHDNNVSVTMNNLVTVPRLLTRRRYTTRDYSSGSIPSNDWLRHPDVVTFSSASNNVPSEPATRANQVEMDHDEHDATLENQENIPPHPGFIPNTTTYMNVPDFDTEYPPPPTLAASTPRTPPINRARARASTQTGVQAHHIRLLQEHGDVERMIEALDVNPLPQVAAAESMTRSTSQTDDVDNEQEHHGPTPENVRDDAQADVQVDDETPSQPTLDSPLRSNSSDHLGLLGPLLSGSQTAPTTISTREPLDFSLLGSTRPGFDSSVLSMTSRIRQARVTRLLRLMSERDSYAGYADRYPWNRLSQADARSMVNHASGSRGTSRADSLEDGLTDLGQDVDSQELTEDGRNTLRNRDWGAPLPPPPPQQQQQQQQPLQPSHFFPATRSSFAEILDCNGNPIDWSNSDSHTSSSTTSSMSSYETMEERDEDMDGWNAVAVEQRRRRRAQLERQRLNHGIVSGHGRSRILRTGTVFEGMDHISEADSLLMENDGYRSLKGSWTTNPNGESWSDDEGEEGPFRRRHGTDADDKDQETVFMRRGGQPSLGVLQPSLQHPQGPSGESSNLYYIYGNVRNRYGPEINGSRRQRVMNEMSDLLRAGSATTSQRTTEEDPMVESIAPSSSMTTGSSEAATSSGSNMRSRHSGPSSQVGGDIREQAMGSMSTTSRQNGSMSGYAEGFMEYEQGHSQYHTQNLSSQGYQSNRVIGTQQQQTQTDQHVPTSRQPSAALMNRMPPLLPAQPQVNEPIPHQIRRAHTSHMVNLQRRWEQQQQQQQILQQMHQQQLQRMLSHGVGGGGAIHGGDLDQDMTQRYPGTIFVPPPSQQAGVPNLMGPPVPMSRGNRSSFRTSHETNGFQHFLLSGVPPPPLPTTAVATTSITSHDLLVGSSSSSSSAATTTSATMPTALFPVASTTAGFPSGTTLSSSATAAAETRSDYSHADQNQQYWRRRARGSNSLYMDYEGGTLKAEERWRRGEKEMVGR